MNRDTRSDETQRELLLLMQELMTEHPDWRLGQLVANIAFLARQTNSATYDVDDTEFLQIGRAHLQKMSERRQVTVQVRDMVAPQMKSAA